VLTLKGERLENRRKTFNAVDICNAELSLLRRCNAYGSREARLGSGLILKSNLMSASYEHISPTAKLVAYMRVLSDIPYSEQISRMTKSDEVAKQKYGYQPESLKVGAVVLEARFKAVSELIRRSGSQSILEIASGVSPRGLIMTENPAITYIETDLPEINGEKQALIKDILEQEKITRPNLHFIAADALDAQQLQAAADLTKGELAIAQEGLFVYMSRQDQEKVAQNVWNILRARGGAWITDVFLRSEMIRQFDPNREATIKTIQQEAGINLQSNAFADNEEVESFFKRAGFSIADKINLFDLKDSLVSPQNVALAPEQLKAALETRYIYLLRAVEK
jgi:O-methyltransferase involved in polyketide biosynthesis